MNKPIITFLVVAYNQELFIREAVESALAQTYSPLEILISDGCSSDRTFDIAAQLVAAYKGPHSVQLSRLENNLGIGEQVNRAVHQSHGKLIVMAAGDDVSLPERTNVIYEAWENSSRKATSIFSSYLTLWGDGTPGPIGRQPGTLESSKLFTRLEGDLLGFLKTRTPVVYGCTHAWAPALIEYFGPMRSDLEDLVLSFRTLGFGEMVYINRPLVKYRRHGGNVSFFGEGDDTRSFEHRELRLHWVDRKSIEAYQNILDDIEVLYSKRRIADLERRQLVCQARRLRDRYSLEKDMMEGNILNRIMTIAGALSRGNLGGAFRFAPRALPRRAFGALYVLKERWKRFRMRKTQRQGDGIC